MSKEIILKYDGSLDIATGRSRKETHWRNRETTWGAFVRKIAETHRTAEKLAEYMSEKKTRQDEIKDVGGYVFGYVNNGRRKAENITHRQAVTLDIDFSKGQIWDDFTMLYANAAAIYSTHKHTSESPRLRLVLPLDRPVVSDEYVAIARRIAGDLDINCFDDTTYEPSRLMYWPSTSKDAEYAFEYQDGPWICADKILARYKNWQDASEWPVSDRTGEILLREIKKQGDPLEKPGVVGAFCRTYNIHEAIETFLDDVYEPCNIEDRYTFKEGSTAAGLVVYDDKYAFSHHGTDPASGKLCNAFDLVRLHLYGLQDEDAKEGTPINRMPSYMAMLELSAKDSKVRKLIGTERLHEAKEEFATDYEDTDGEPVNNDWLGLLSVDTKGNFKNTIDNIMIILDNDPAIKNKLALNEFEQREVVLGDLPWRKAVENRFIQDSDDAGIRYYLEKTYGIKSRLDTKDAFDLTVKANRYHPIKDYLTSVNWDGELRLETLLIDYLGAEDCPYVRTVTRKILVAAVTRIFRPGCKFDYVLVLIGEQGKGKSTIIKKLGGVWYSDSFDVNAQGKEAFEQIQGVWLVEMAELAGLKKADIEATKHFISKCEDRYRVAYGRRIDNFPRQCIFFGTTNNKDFLLDPTGNRRFWPVDIYYQDPVKSVFEELDQYRVDQIWAEAVKFYHTGETLYLSSELEKTALIKQSEHREVDERTGLIQEYLEKLLPESWAEMDYYQRRNFIAGEEIGEIGKVRRNFVCGLEIWCELFGKQKADFSNSDQKTLQNILRSIDGWEKEEKKHSSKIYGRQKGFIRTEKWNGQQIDQQLKSPKMLKAGIN